MALHIFNHTSSLYRSPASIIIFFVCLLSGLQTVAQVGAEVELKKPAQYENRKLASERTGEKKFTLRRRIMQNTTTHYNYYFNANNRLNDVISRAKSAFQDDYSQLLPFYNYTLEATSGEKSELDSVIYKATAGILLHDLRSDWVDNMYLMMAKAYLFRNDLDSATITLQYLNFAFAPKEEGGYDIPIGSSSSNETGEFSIATKENRNLLKKMTSRPPSRNESFIWQIRTYIEHGELPEAAGLIEILKNDPSFPSRLRTQLNEVTAYWYYKQDVYDSAANYLSQALNEADNAAETARWEYLIGQLYQTSNQPELAATYYAKSIQHTSDPVMDVYARLNTLKLNRGDGKDYAQQNLDALLNMAKRDKYINYRDIIYYAAASIELDRKNRDAAQDLLLKSVKFTNNNPRQRSQSFLLLADMNYDTKKYTPASNFYDSIDINALKTQNEKDRVVLRKPPLKIVAANEAMVFNQDSLQALALMPEEKRNAIVKTKLKQLQKEKGVVVADDQQSSNPAILQRQAADLFGDNSKNTEFYFYNASLKARGFSEFKSKWGQRPNVDNWRRMSAINQQSNTNPDMTISDVPMEDKAAPTELSYEGLLETLPTTEEKLKASNQDIEKALNTLGETFLSQLEDYPSAIDAYEELLKRFPTSEYRDKALFNLVYAYSKTGDPDKSAAYKKQLISTSDTSKYAQLLLNPNLQKKEDKALSPATKQYEQIYNKFIEGDFVNAVAEKKAADSLYGKSYWTPQLLFIESVYYVSRHDDSTAIKVLTDLSSDFATSPMAEKAKTMIDVLKRRNEIEDYLTKLEVTRKEDSASGPSTYVRPKQEIAVIQKPTGPATQVAVKKDSIAAPINIPKNEPKPPVKEQPVVAKPVVKDTAVTVVPKVLPKATAKDTAVAVVPKAPPKAMVKDTVVSTKSKPVAKDTAVAIIPKPVDVPAIIVKGFEFKPADPHFVLVVLDKVDPVYASEAKNAFNRYNREKFYNSKPVEINSVKIDDRFNLILQGPFSDANAAVGYIDVVRPVTGSRILPWLGANKYSFLVISAENLEVLKTNPDMDAYRLLIQKAFPGKF